MRLLLSPFVEPGGGAHTTADSKPSRGIGWTGPCRSVLLSITSFRTPRGLPSIDITTTTMLAVMKPHRRHRRRQRLLRPLTSTAEASTHTQKRGRTKSCCPSPRWEVGVLHAILRMRFHKQGCLHSFISAL